MMRRFLVLFEPFILMLLGTVLLASIVPPHGMWAVMFGWAAEAGVVLLFFLHGAKLSRDAVLEGARNWRLHAATLGTTFLIFPLLGLALTALPVFDGPLRVGLLFLTLLPSTVQSSIAFTAIARGNVAAAVCSASFSNLAGIVVTPLLVALLMHGHAAALSWNSVKPILFQLLLPFALGHALRPLIGGFVTRHKPLMTVIDRGSILLVVYTAFGAAVVEGLWRRLSPADLALIALCCTILLGCVLAITGAMGRALRLTPRDRTVLLFCGSKKSLASGVPMAGVLFAPAQVGLVVLPLMLFHQIQLIACAMIARRLAARADASFAGDVSP